VVPRARVGAHNLDAGELKGPAALPEEEKVPKRTARQTLILIAATGLALMPLTAGARDDAPPADALVKELMTRDLAGNSGKEILMITVEYLPGGASLPHRHNAQVFVYVLDGEVRMQVQGSPAVTLGPGKTFYEGPEDIHTVSANASRTKSARLLVFMVRDKGTPVSSPAVPQGHP
jgi:quercetin dioxygenase-like cupin family protein